MALRHNGMSNFRWRIVAALVIVTFSSVVIYAAWVFSAPPSSQINVIVSPNGGYLQNITVSCHGCVPHDKAVWKGSVTIGTVTIPYQDATGNSTGITFKLASAVPITKDNPCHSDYWTNSSCVYPLGPFPLNMSFSFEKTSDGGMLKAIVYLTNDNWFPFETTSGNLSSVFSFKSE